MSCKPRLNKFRSLVCVGIGGALTFAGLCFHRGDDGFYSRIFMPFTQKFIDEELAHEMCIFATRHNLIKCRDSLTDVQSASLRVPILNMQFSNPIGLAAGFDKSCHAGCGLKHYGFGFVEFGTVTPRPQPGNPKKRCFRLPELRALVNRFGFNNDGIEEVKKNLHQMSSCKPMILGLNIGKNKDTDDMFDDFVQGIESTHDLPMIDYLVVNVSSPNTPGLRKTQEKENLSELIERILLAKKKMKIDKPILIKIAPDISDQQKRDIAQLVMEKNIDGLIISNTTITRPLDLLDAIETKTSENVFLTEQGGLSGPPLNEMSTRLIADFYSLTHGKVPIIGVGGISTGKDAYDKIRAGASLVQIYTCLTYEGPPIVNRIKQELAQLLERDRFKSVTEAIGFDNKQQ